jgi:hypothetical protein
MRTGKGTEMKLNTLFRLKIGNNTHANIDSLMAAQ